MTFVRDVWDAHLRLPIVLQVWVLAPAAFVFTIVAGLLFALPPGPLCDEGMVLFMEGGCDWGISNIFFFSKVCLLLTVTAAFAMAWFRPAVRPIAFVPHIALLLLLAAGCDTDFGCGDYYGHPNGTTGQMIVEAVAWIVAGLALLSFRNGRWPRLLLVLFLWNGLHVGVFYAGLLFTNHWTWLHTVWIASVLCASGAVAGVITTQRRFV